MERFKKYVLEHLEKGQKISGADRMLVNHIIDDFTRDYHRATKMKPQPWSGTLYYILPRFQVYGFSMPEVESLARQELMYWRSACVRQSSLGLRVT